MSKPYLSKTRTRNFSTLNCYKRTLGKGGQTTNKESWDSWECKYTGETVGYSYEEDQQSYKRLLEYDKKHGTNHAEFYANFHELWYWDNVDPSWSARLKADRRKDIYTNSQRVDMMDLQKSESASEMEVTHNPSMGLNILDKSAEKIPKRKSKTRYSDGDYQYTINPLHPKWADILITKIDYDRGVGPHTEGEVGIVFLSRGKTRWGYTAPYHGLWIVSIVYAGEEPVRVATNSQALANDVMEDLKERFKDHAVSRVDPEFFMWEGKK